MGDTCRVIVLGSTGSIGTQTLDVIAHLQELHQQGQIDTEFRVVGLAAMRNICSLSDQRNEFDVEQAAICEDDTNSLRDRGFRTGAKAAVDLIREVECDIVVGAISGVAGLEATWAGVELGRDVALANKETLVAAGSLIVPLARRTGSRLLPVDSEHSGVWQCLMGRAGEQAPPMEVADVARVTLTASGGPFRTWTREQIEKATVEQALKHPTWSMGRKVTIDSASLMNKALEIIEAHCLFGLPGDRISAAIHPQSIVHALVEFADGSVVAQCGAPDMKTPIQHALTWPRRVAGCSRKIDWTEVRKLEFEPVDGERFPAVDLAYRVISAGGNAGAVMNAANEAAVAAFLAGRIGFGGITDLTRRAMDAVKAGPIASFEDVLIADRNARECVERMIY